MTTLQQARDLLADPTRWTQHASARDAAGQRTASTASDAVCWCTSGSLAKVGGISGRDRDRLITAAQQLGYVNPIHVNDETDHATVLKMFDLAIRP